MNYFYSLIVAACITCPCYGAWVEKTLPELTLREKIGQLFVVSAASDFGDETTALAEQFSLERDSMKPPYIEKLIREHAIGGVIFLMKSTPGKQMALTNRYQELSKLPLLICLDAEWGLSMRLNETMRFPRNMTLGALQDEQLVFQLGKEIGRQCRAIGVHVNLAPVVDVNNNTQNVVISDRSFGEDKERVARLGEAYTAGLRASGVLDCAKHFPGHGDTSVDSHHALPCINHSQAHMEETELYPFKQLIAQGVEAIMMAHLAVPAFDATHTPSSLSYPIVTELLKNKLGFKGLVISDGLNMGALKSYGQGTIELKAVCAGTDILLCPTDVPRAIELIEQAVLDGTIPREELDAKVLKILKAKEWADLHIRRQIDIPQALRTIMSDDARALKRELYQRALTLVRNENALPVNAQEVPVIQIGGAAGTPFVLSFAVVLYQPVQASQDEVEKLLERVQGMTRVVIGIFEMNKLAQKNFGLSPSTLALIKKLKELQKQIILTLFGNAYSLRNFGDEAAILVAYEDDPDAQCAAAEVLRGTLKAQGKLPVSASEQFRVGCGL